MEVRYRHSHTDAVPAATLLLPYFEVGLSTSSVAASSGVFNHGDLPITATPRG